MSSNPYLDLCYRLSDLRGRLADDEDRQLLATVMVTIIQLASKVEVAEELSAVKVIE